jgi:hypothetical protein
MSAAHNSGRFKKEKCLEKRIICLVKPRAEGAGRPSQQIEVFDLETNLSTTYESIYEAARTLNFPQSIISKYFTNNQQNLIKEGILLKSYNNSS